VKHAKHEHMEHMAVEIHARFFSFRIIIVPVRSLLQDFAFISHVGSCVLKHRTVHVPRRARSLGGLYRTIGDGQRNTLHGMVNNTKTFSFRFDI
jgi:hypothetical protein